MIPEYQWSVTSRSRGYLWSITEWSLNQSSGRDFNPPDTIHTGQSMGVVGTSGSGTIQMRELGTSPHCSSCCAFPSIMHGHDFISGSTNHQCLLTQRNEACCLEMQKHWFPAHVIIGALMSVCIQPLTNGSHSARHINATWIWVVYLAWRYWVLFLCCFSGGLLQFPFPSLSCCVDLCLRYADDTALV